ncbi:MAG: 1-hydroxycarotenoid 3,4-desaturase CrtD [Bacteroidota bacterium]
MKVGIIGAGVGGLGAAIRFASAGHDVAVFEANHHAGGKINSLTRGPYRWDMGPSVFTGPEYIRELYALCGEDFSSFEYQKLDESFRYFYRDGTRFALRAEPEKLVQTIAEELGENPAVLRRYLDKCGKNYKAIAPLFIESSLHRWRHLINRKLLKALSRIPKYKLGKTMHGENNITFKNPKTTQLFNRYATYNGSSPYKAPAMLNMIQHLELNEGVFLPKNGMVQIAQSLMDLAQKQGVQFYFGEKVQNITLDNDKVSGLKTDKREATFDSVVSNMDVLHTYDKLLSDIDNPPAKILNQERSSSAIVFYWGIKKTFSELGVHNMFFAEDYEAEFKALFETRTLHEDPSIYIHITSKEKSGDAPEGKENWFAMINAPINTGQDWETYRDRARTAILQRLSKELNCAIAPLIEEEFVMDAPFIEKHYSGAQGSIYGNSSNNKYAAFYRHPNFSKTIKGLYFVGVTVHPGGGIPLALNSAKIAFECFREDYS